MQIKTFKTAPKFDKLQNLAVAVQTGGTLEISRALLELQTDDAFSTIGWQKAFNLLADAFADHKPRFSIFALQGNEKLPFVAFSTLPGVTCPGAGECIKFCYSYRAWRYPNAFARMVQNAYFLRFAPDVIADAFATIANERPEGFDFRLYVDGDFSSISDVAFWMSLLSNAPMVRAYGYSKSFMVLLAYANAGNEWPENYRLNISSGHNASETVVRHVKALPITRGEFIAVNIGRTVRSSDHGTAPINKALREAFPGEKIFPCPGACGSCTGKGHACGISTLKGITIAIAVH